MSWIDDHFWNPINEFGHKVFGGGPGHEDEGSTDWYIGYSTTGGVQGYVRPNSGQPYNTRNMAGKGYSRNTAATAKDIAQGGMTKEEIQQFNIAHPNETAWRKE